MYSFLSGQAEIKPDHGDNYGAGVSQLAHTHFVITWTCRLLKGQTVGSSRVCEGAPVVSAGPVLILH